LTQQNNYIQINKQFFLFISKKIKRTPPKITTKCQFENTTECLKWKNIKIHDICSICKQSLDKNIKKRKFKKNAIIIPNNQNTWDPENSVPNDYHTTSPNAEITKDDLH